MGNNDITVLFATEQVKCVCDLHLHIDTAKYNTFCFVADSADKARQRHIQFHPYPTLHSQSQE